MKYEDELKKNSYRNLKLVNPNYSKREVIEMPRIFTLNTLRNPKNKKSSYWMHIPDKLMQKMGIRVSSSHFDLRVILVKKE
jgi:hypothetical protein